MYRVIVSKKVQKMIDAIPQKFRDEIEEIIESLSYNPRPHGTVKLTGFKDTYRIRLADYRVVYSINDDTIVVTIEKVEHRKDIYR